MQAKHRFLSRRIGGRYRADASDALIEEIAACARRLSALLRDPTRTRFTWVLVAEPLALAETQDGLGEIRAFGAEGRREASSQVSQGADQFSGTTGTRASR
jgi:hypothetical protein